MSIITLPSNPPEVVEMAKAFNQGPPEDLHPGNVEGDSPALKGANGTLQQIWDGAAALNEQRANPDPEHRAATHDRIMREANDAFERNSIAKLDSAFAALKAELADEEADLADKAGLKPDTTWRFAVVGTIHDMRNAGDQAAAINGMIEQGDHASLAALIDAPLVATGLTAEVRDSIKPRVFLKVDAQAVSRIEQLKLAVERFDKAMNAAPGMFAKLRAGTEPGAYRERAKQAALGHARSNFNNS